jgi:cold shock CspA family protein/ribosome-associated translation inhibitor RaiA
MQKPLEIVFRGMERMEGIERLVEEKVAKLERVCDYITSCRVAVERPQLYQKTGSPFRVRIDMHVPRGHEIVVKRECTEGDMHDSLQMVVRDAFKAARLSLEEIVQKQRHQIKPHFADSSVAVVHRLLADEGYGFLITKEGREVYFHQNSLTNLAFESLRLGDTVRFTEEQGEDGPQAATVELVQRTGAPVEAGQTATMVEAPFRTDPGAVR